MSTTSTRPPRTEHVPAGRPRRRTLDLSAAQLIATALAAVVATLAASFLGVAGTVAGTALFSVVAAIGKEVFGTSLSRTGERVREVVPVTRGLPRVGHTDGTPHGLVTDTVEADTVEADTVRADPDAPTDDEPPELPAPGPQHALRRPAWRRVAAAAAIIFIGVLACVTAVEVFVGRPVSDLVRGDAGHGTTLFGNETVRTTTVPPTAPTVTVTVTPKVVVTTPTQTRTAAPVIESTTPAPSTSAAPTTSSTAPRSTPASTATTSPRP